MAAKPIDQLPVWLTEDLIGRALGCSRRSTGLRLRELRPNHPPDKGDHYLSRIYWVTVDLEDFRSRYSVRLVVKTLPRGGHEMQTFAEHAFEAESAMLCDVLPRLDALLEGAGLQGELGPRCLLQGERVPGAPGAVLVMEDLTEQGFRLADRRVGLCLRHCLIVVRTLAKMHAASRRLIEAGEDLYGRFPSASFGSWVMEQLRVAGLEVAQWDELPRRFGRAIVSLADGAQEYFFRVNEPLPPAMFNVLLHGDLWANNMLFQYKAGTPVALRLLDFQIAHVGSPAIDLIYFLHSSVSEDVYKYHTDVLLSEYASCLNETLGALGCARTLPLEELQREMHARGKWALFPAFFILPLAQKEPEEEFDLDAAMRKPSLSSKLFRTCAFRRWMRHVLPRFESEGWFFAARYSRSIATPHAQA